ncbi:MAG: sulfotransferase family protein [Candidatus Limnocylindrales bacterium]
MVATTERTATEPMAAVPARLPTEPEAIFIVGVPRSGTTMMRYLLETSDRIAIARENHFMGHILGRRGARHFFRRAGDLRDDASVRKIVDMIYSGEYEKLAGWRRPSPYWFWLKDEVPREEIERRLLAAERTERGLFQAFLRIYADIAGKPVMGEKTPTHLNYVDTLLQWFPDARVIHMLRDPRAVYVSDRYRRQTRDRFPYSLMKRVPLLLESYLLLLYSVSWRRALGKHATLLKRHPGKYMLVRFEDVVKKPDETLPGVFGFLGVEMPASVEADVEVPQKHGMRSSSEGIDPKAADRWRERIKWPARRFLELTLKGPMRRFGYGD